jgi:hypothetical protein
MNKWIELIRGLVRPVITVSGWAVLLGLLVFLVKKFATEDLALAAFSFFTGAISILIAWWFKDRSDKHNGTPVP